MTDPRQPGERPPTADNAPSHLRNALQILRGIEGELAAVDRRIALALAQDSSASDASPVTHPSHVEVAMSRTAPSRRRKPTHPKAKDKPAMFSQRDFAIACELALGMMRHRMEDIELALNDLDEQIAEIGVKLGMLCHPR